MKPDLDGTGIRLLRGRALVQLNPDELGEHTTAAGVIVPGSAVKPREQKSHRGRILALGPPARQGHDNGPEIPWGCEVGDEIVFFWAVWLERMRRFEGVAFIAQSEIAAVIEV